MAAECRIVGDAGDMWCAVHNQELGHCAWGDAQRRITDLEEKLDATDSNFGRAMEERDAAVLKADDLDKQLEAALHNHQETATAFKNAVADWKAARAEVDAFTSAWIDYEHSYCGEDVVCPGMEAHRNDVLAAVRERSISGTARGTL